jgi:hypothetical protein
VYFTAYTAAHWLLNDQIGTTVLLASSVAVVQTLFDSHANEDDSMNTSATTCDVDTKSALRDRV